MREAIEREAFRCRCIAHGQWMDANPAVRDELLAQAEAAAQEIDYFSVMLRRGTGDDRGTWCVPISAGEVAVVDHMGRGEMIV